MPVTGSRAPREGARAAAIFFLCVVALSIAAQIDAAMAQSGPFGVGRPPEAAAPDGVVGWIIAKQAEFYRGLSGAVRAAKTDGSAVWGLFAFSFFYGIFHAAGPGHAQGGDLVLSRRQRGDLEARRRPVVRVRLSAGAGRCCDCRRRRGSAGATAGTMNTAVRWIEIVSYALIALIGARLIYVKGRAFLAALRGEDHHHGHAHDHQDHAHAHGHHNHDHGAHSHAQDQHHHGHADGDHKHAHHNHDHAHHAHDHAHEHVHDEHCGHSHGPVPF